MFASKGKWIVSLGFLVILLVSLAVTDGSLAARLTGPAGTSRTSFSYIILKKRVQASATQAVDKIEDKLQLDFEVSGSADFIVRFTKQADLSLAYSMDWNARGEYVYNTLRGIAANSQAKAKAILDAGGYKYQTFIAGNDLYVWGGNLAIANQVASLPEVSFIRATRTYSIDPIVEVKPLENITWAGDLLVNRALSTVSSPNALDWGITDTKADQFWSTFGVQGDSILAASIDTGVDFTHVALDQSYKCLADPTSPACWLDPYTDDCPGANVGPCDTVYQGVYHGTHTMGTMVGDDDPTLAYQVGMVPKAQWIACLGCPNGSCPDLDLNACADWVLAPNGNSANRPNVVNNSWGGPGDDTWFQAKVQSWVAAGIFPAFSAGNEGELGCDSLGSPGDYQESFGSAAHDSGRTIAYFSSRGPSAFGDNPYTKPNISAPGVSIISTKPGDKWYSMSGTSMASPHSAGAVALLWSCNPDLIGQIDATFQLLQNNTDTAPAGSCGAPASRGGNYTYGYGYLNLLKVGQAGCAPTAVSLVDFVTKSIPHSIQLSWQTTQEIGLVGFNLYRAEALDGPRVKINPELIQAINPGQFTDNRYRYPDTTVETGLDYNYWIEWVGENSSVMIGPKTGFLPNYIWLPLSYK